MNRITCAAAFSLAALAGASQTAPDAEEILRRIGSKRGICALVGLERDALPLDLARASELLVYVQVADDARAAALRRAASEAGLLGTRLYVERGRADRIHLAEAIADAIVTGSGTPRAEALRVLRPGGTLLLGSERAVKPFPEGADEWTHPYHGPDNNPQSRDRVARPPFLTRFMAEPWYAAMPQQSVVSGGRIFKAYGERSSAQPQWPMLHMLLCMNAYNGALLWQRKLNPGFMVARNTMVATPEALWLGDDVSCKKIEAATGRTLDEIVVPEGLSDGPVWKWMALEGGVLYALVGEKEGDVETVKGDRYRGAGWPWWRIPGYAYGFGRTVLAIDPASKRILWHHREADPIDSRALCMAAGRIFIYSHPKSLAALEARTGRVLWRTTDAGVLAAVGEHDAAQHPMKGFSSTAYARCDDKVIVFAGPQRTKIAAVSAADGKLLWQREGGNSLIVIREDGVYALGEGRTNSTQTSVKLEPLTGKVLAQFASRDRCTRATGSADFIFTRGGKGGSTAVFDVTSAEPRVGVVTPMRPACQDGVVVANGLFYWGPWICRCDGTQIGAICLGPGGGLDYSAEAREAERLEGSGRPEAPLDLAAEDWPTFRRDNARTAGTGRAVPGSATIRWTADPLVRAVPTAPVAAGGLVFTGGADGSVRALDAADGKERWRASTGGSIKYPPSIWEGRAFVGSGDGWIYCLEAATGRTLWRFRAAPVERRVPIFGELLSTWPVGSGVLVEGGVAYAAAGNANFDGTHVYALDAATGKIRWQNHTSGHLYAERPDSGAGVQGHLLLHQGAIYMAGGSLVPIAKYDLADGKFNRAGGGGDMGKDLYVQNGQVRSSGHWLYWRPEDAHFIVSAALPSPAGTVLVAADQIGLGEPGSAPQQKPRFVWSAKPFQENAAVAVTSNALVVAGVDRTGMGPDVRSTAGLCALSITDGKELWRHALPSSPVGWGLCVDRAGRVIVSLQDGRILCLAP